MGTVTPLKAGPPDIPMPHSTEAEAAVIGSLIIDRDAIVRVAPFLRAEDFYTERYGTLYQAVQTMYERRVPADHVTLMHELERVGMLNDVGWPDLLTIVANTPSAAHIMYYAQIVVDTAMRRALIRNGGNIAALGYDKESEVGDLISRAQQLMVEATERGGDLDYRPVELGVAAFLDRLDALHGQGEIPIGVDPGYLCLKPFLRGGMRRGHLILVAARTSVGKTALSLCVARNVAKAGGKVAVFSLEMSEGDLIERLVSMEARIDNTKFTDGRNLDEEEWGRAADHTGRISNWPMFIDDKAGLRLGELALRAERIQAEQGQLDLVLVDYIQLMRGTPRRDGNQVIELGEIANGLKRLARQMNVPVLACCQVNREPENRPDKVPQLSDLRGSGDLEQAADVVIMLYREDMHDKSTERTGVCDLYIRKNRGGPQGQTALWFHDPTTSFFDLDRRQ